MDKTQIIILVMNAVITIVTTAVVIRLSLNQGKLGLTQRLKTKLTTKVKAYILLFFSIGMVIYASIFLYFELKKTEPITRYDVLTIASGLVLAAIWFTLASFISGFLLYRKRLIKIGESLREAIKETLDSKADKPNPKD